MKFKKGDKVKILPPAMDVGVYSKEVGKMGVVISINKRWCELQIKMDKPSTIHNQIRRRIWYVHPSQIELVVIVGQQLLFSFMKDT